MSLLQQNPVVSFLMTAYNREKYIAQAIESVLNSTFKDFELIVLDDCSKDSTVEIATSFARRDSRVVVIQNEKNLGDYPNRNKIAEYAKGKYLKYLDADDLIYPWGLEILVNSMEQFPQAGWGLCSLEQDKEVIYPFMLQSKEIFEYHYFKSPLFNKAPLSSIIRSDAFKQVKGFSGKQHVGDCELWHVLAMKYPLVLMPHGMVWYRQHDDQQMQANRTDARVPFKYWVGGYYFFRLNNSIPLEPEKRQFIIDDYEKKMNRLIKVKFMKLQWKLAFELLRMKKNTQLSFGNY